MRTPTLKGFSEEIGEHRLSVPMAKSNVVVIETVLKPKMTNVDMMGALAGRGATVTD
jgi:hypothetical protein